MTQERDTDSVRLVNKFFSDVVKRRDYDQASHLVAPDVKVHLTAGREVEGLEGLKEAVGQVSRGQSWSSLKLDQTATVGGFVVAGWSMGRGRLFRRPGRPQAGAAAAVFRTSESRITEIWGLVPPPAEPEEEFEGDDDDDDFVGGRPPGPKWTPPIPKPPKGRNTDPGDGAP